MSNDINSGVYKITNTVNGKIYVGSAIDLERRQRQHFSTLHSVFVKTHESLKDTAIYLVVKPPAVWRHINGGRKHVKGFILKYSTNE